jgi:hypothetical protein
MSHLQVEHGDLQSLLQRLQATLNSALSRLMDHADVALLEGLGGEVADAAKVLENSFNHTNALLQQIGEAGSFTTTNALLQQLGDVGKALDESMGQQSRVGVTRGMGEVGERSLSASTATARVFTTRSANRGMAPQGTSSLRAGEGGQGDEVRFGGLKALEAVVACDVCEVRVPSCLCVLMPVLVSANGCVGPGGGAAVAAPGQRPHAPPARDTGHTHER